jgi:hypothetical protein
VALVRTDVSEELSASFIRMRRIDELGATLKNYVFWDLVRADVSEVLSASVIRVTKIGELGTTLALASNRRTLRRNTSDEGGANFLRNVGSYKSHTAVKTSNLPSLHSMKDAVFCDITPCGSSN